MKTETIMTDFMDRTAKIIEEMRNRSRINVVDTEVIEAMLKDAFNEYCDALNGYYEEEYYIAISSARSKAYDDGHSDGYADGYDVGYADCHAKNSY